VAGLELSDELRSAYRGGPGVLMLVDYTASPVGPYREVLFAAGRFRMGGRTAFTIPRILVSTAASVVAGRANWGLPKEQADFEWTSEGPRRDRVRVSLGGSVFFDAVLEHGRVPFPVFAAPWLLPFTLGQPREGRVVVTTLRGAGIARRARLSSLRVDGRLFPDLSALRPLLGLRIAPFRLVFPRPESSRP
jgi:hypothetical protein